MSIKIFSASHIISCDVMHQPHIHDFYEIYLVLSDNVQIETEYGFYNTSFGDFFVFEPFSFHKITSSNIEFNRCLMQFDENFVISSAPCLKEAFEFIKCTRQLHFKADVKTAHRLTEIFDRAVYIHQNNVPMKTFQTISCIGEILTILQTLPQLNIPTPKPQDQFSKILKYVHGEAIFGITVKNICDKFFISSTTLHKLFKENLRISPGDYMIRVKLNYAMKLLQNGASVAEAAEQSGFNSYSHFIRIFKNRTGLPPHKYSKKV